MRSRLRWITQQECVELDISLAQIREQNFEVAFNAVDRRLLARKRRRAMKDRKQYVQWVTERRAIKPPAGAHLTMGSAFFLKPEDEDKVMRVLRTDAVAFAKYMLSEGPLQLAGWRREFLQEFVDGPA